MEAAIYTRPPWKPYAPIYAITIASYFLRLTP
jgi:hypothetical protein